MKVQSSHTWAPTKLQPRGQIFGSQGGGLWKLLQGGGGKQQSRVWEGYGKKIFAPQFFMQNQGVKKKILEILLY